MSAQDKIDPIWEELPSEHISRDLSLIYLAKSLESIIIIFIET